MKFIILSLILFGCSSKEPKEKPIIYGKNNPEVNTTNPEKPSITAKELAAELGSNSVTEISFTKGRSTLEKKHRLKLKKLYKETKSQKIDKVLVISWGDKNLKNSSSIDQQNLAAARLSSVKNYLKQLNKNLKIEEINMAQRPAKISSLMGTEKSKISKSLEIQGSQKDSSLQTIVIFVPKKK